MSSMKPIPIFLFSFIISFDSLLVYISAEDTIVVNQTIRDGQTIVSAQETFELGFFSPGNMNQNRYLGIWYKRLASGTVAWVANRETPIRNKTGELTLRPDGTLVLLDSSSNRIIWSSDLFGAIRSPMARLFDSGNLMVSNDDDGPENYIWQSFDHPGNTFLPGLKLGRNVERGVVRNITSWKNVDDPSPGPYMVYWDYNGVPQIFQRNGDVIQFRLGLWNGLRFTGMPSLKPNPIFTYGYDSNAIETYSYFNLINTSVLTKMMLDPLGNMGWLNWIDRTQGWFLYMTPTVDNCVRYALCGVYGSCNIEQSPACECLKGFTPKKPDEWGISDWTSGCHRQIPLNCVGDGFRKYSSMKLPDTRQSWFDRNMTLEQCEVKCRNECNCTAYTTLDIKDDIGCLLWYEELIDMRVFSDGQDIYIRIAAGELEKDKKVSKEKMSITVIVISVTVGFAILLVLSVLIIKRKRKLKAQDPVFVVTQDPMEQKDIIDLPLFSYPTLLIATDNFSFNNKLGEGGFGPVYKGILEDGLEIAVKRLSADSSQGVEEFKNEVLFISKLQHRNLVRILGCCVERQERMLVYEYMPNKGLDLIIFDETESRRLNWSQRFHIINGIARGLLYLHQDSRLRIIHRDLKAANILLDQDMNPKISDFGLARSFGGNETESNTKRVVGTYGYMSPEYAGEGIFSVKSDIFSFGVLVLEMVSGKKNRGFIHEDHNHNLLGHAWRLHREGKSLELVDAYLTETDHIRELLIAIHVALLCVQQNPIDRPNMSTVVMMLSSNSPLPEPKQPGFYTEEDRFGPQNSASIERQHSNNEVTTTLLNPR